MTPAALGLAAWVAVCFLAPLPGMRSLPGAWYASLAKPAWNPPGSLFGPVWTLLYASMGVAAWMVWMRGGFPAQRGPLAVFALQLALNALWSPIFFGLRRPDLAFVIIAALWASVAWALVLFWQVRPAAGAILVPYLVWITFAAALNLTIWRLNDRPAPAAAVHGRGPA